MYFVMARLDAPKFCRLDFIVNFGILPETKSQMTNLIESASSAGQVTKFL